VSTSPALIEILVRPQLDASVDEAKLCAAALAALDQDPCERQVEITVVLTDDREIQELNRTYRGIDSPTDVLSFEMGEHPHSPPDEPLYLGDIVISLPRSAEQAAERGHSVQRELHLLVIHGTLHLLGHDHATIEEERAMWKLQDAALDSLDPADQAPGPRG